MDALATQLFAQIHVVRHELDMRKAEADERRRDILRNRLVALPGAAVLGLVKHAARLQLVAAEDHGDTHPRLELFDAILQLTRLESRWPRGPP
jgi:hypothetical protein